MANAAVARRARSRRAAQTPAAEHSTGLSAGARRAKLGIVERETRGAPFQESAVATLYREVRASSQATSKGAPEETRD
jgi:hypothetical protein